MSNPPFYTHRLWRLPIDLLVVAAVLYYAGTFAITLLDPYDFYDTLPDNIQVLDEEIIAYLETAPAVVWDGVVAEYELIYAADAQARSAVTVYQEALPSVVYLNTFDGFGYFAGSGIVLSAAGLIATNYHVIEGAEKIGVTFSDEYTTHAVSVVAYDKEKDIAILLITTDRPLTPARLRPTSETLQIGEPTYNIGHPENLIYTLGAGAITGIRDYTNSGMGEQIQMSNPISQGSSGGPLLDQAGRLIGLTTWSLEYDANSVQVQSLNFAIPLPAVTDLLTQSR